LARHEKHDGSGDEKARSVFVCDLELEETVEQDVDRLLEFFSCPMPALVSLSKDEQRRQMRKNIRQKGNVEEFLETLAHCSSFKQLQYVASEIKKWNEELRANNQ
jgi:electron transfer flavoprotein alpha/beta subunit